MIQPELDRHVSILTRGVLEPLGRVIQGSDDRSGATSRDHETRFLEPSERLRRGVHRDIALRSESSNSGQAGAGRERSVVDRTGDRTMDLHNRWFDAVAIHRHDPREDRGGG